MTNPCPKSRSIGRITLSLDDGRNPLRLRLDGRALFLTQDAARVRRQLTGARLEPEPGLAELFSHVSTDAIIKANPDCYYYDHRLGERVLRSLGNGAYIEPGELRAGGFGLILAGPGWGEGSSREVAALALLQAGIGAIFAPSIAPIHRQNLINNGMIPLTDEGLARRLARGEWIDFDEVVADWDALSVAVLRAGGLLAYLRALDANPDSVARIATPHRAMTIAERIMARHMRTRHGAVRPGDAGILEVDVAFSHDYATAIAASSAELALGRPVRVASPNKIHAFPDHLGLAHQQAGVTPEALAGIHDLRTAQAEFAQRTGIHWHAQTDGSAQGICHTVVRERIGLPGQTIVGTDSHTCSAGALNALAYGIGNSEIAGVWEWNRLLARVPASVRIELRGSLRGSCTAKDVILHLAGVGRRSSIFTGKVMEFGGPGLATLPFEEQAVLANMAVECNALTAICEPTPAMLDALARQRGLPRAEIESRCVWPDPDARYDHRLTVDLDIIETLVAKPGHPGNGVPISEVRGTPLDIAYGGSCTAGDLGSIRQYAEVLEQRQVRIPTYVQYGSHTVREAALQGGLHDILVAAGVNVITEPSCGACVNAGPGGPAQGQTAISATNRNMPGRMGAGDVYLANPRVLAASAVLGWIAGPEDLPPVA
ncbi:MAG: aconitase family protein [Pigmentiphaga sp.]|nr:aconitase family protein [Pigmentiphaga sp.]